ncbi:NlpC/P60 family protein [Magnetospirillum sulfuroxidans]|uniref:C40 family peptidase n=1 Tax=Magnetospirillum sulfuroxidans TaxID=611300 RepID=A0ABS5IA42_9PROT|nr:NlpC/P60 family protein [Magnetospirillum sulfuroxidans]MBR9971194.1 C40 family peptidase [Magnetospirillum sulfuroxidans]
MTRECQSPVGAPHWAIALIGLPWSVHGGEAANERIAASGGSGPDSFNCWEFVRMVQARHFGRLLPEIGNPEDMLVMGRTFRDHPERRRWAKVETPAEGDCVLLRRSRHPIHVGVWLDVDGGGVLHCAEGAGVVFQRSDALALNGWAVEGFYRFIGDQ